jgi:NADH-quinone oxidoreductase subunit H
MNLGWKVLIPLSLAWLLLLASFRLAQDQGWNRVLVAVIAVVVAGLCAALLLAAMKVSARNREREGAMY